MRFCMLCKSSQNDDLKYGELITVQDVTVHYFCLLFAPALYTRGADDEGIRGFLIEDILKECKRVEKIRCYFCLAPNASLGCCVQKCKLAYHLECGLDNDISLEFSENFPTYCKRHAKHFQKENPKLKDACGICMERFGRLKRAKPILIPCCKNSWFHRDCLQKFAITSGVYFKCPLCNDKDRCLAELPLLGIFIPNKDADWEYDFEEFNETIDPPEKTCDSTNCKLTQIYYNSSPWMWKTCSTCGSSAIHISCFLSDDEFNCQMCMGILDKLKQPDQSDWSNDKENLNQNLPKSQSTRNPLSDALDDDLDSSLAGSPNILQFHAESLQKVSSNKSAFKSWFSDDEPVSEDDFEISSRQCSWNCSCKRKRDVNETTEHSTSTMFKNKRVKLNRKLGKGFL